MNVTKTTITITFVGLLAGCGDGSSGVAQRATYADLLGEFSTIDAQFDRGNIAAMSDPATLPSFGNTRYDGVLGINLTTSAGASSIIGDMTMTASFQDSTISGAVTGFVDDAEQNYSGALAITDGVIDRSTDLNTQFTFAADLDGRITNESLQNIDVDMTLRGDFYGAGQEFVAGNMVGEVVTPDGAETIDGSDTYFVGQR
jgi:hypothetical protein